MPTEATTLTLSHWPGSPPVPTSLEADLSAQMAFRYLDHPEPLHGAASAVTNNHFDQDGLVSIYALADPETASSRQVLLEDLAAAGDFATYRHRDAARASMVVSAFTDESRSPFSPLPEDYTDLTALLYREALGLLPELLDHPERFRSLWEDEDRDLDASEAAIASGAVTIDEHHDVDLAVVTVAGPARWSGHRFGGRRYDGLHPMAIHRATACSALLLIAEGTCRFTYRYEGWVQYRSRSIPRRVDLAPLAAALTAADSVRWQYDPVDALTPELAPASGEVSNLPPGTITAMVLEHLRTAPTAFDPYAKR
jgi:hypothetical protein